MLRNVEINELVDFYSIVYNNILIIIDFVDLLFNVNFTYLLKESYVIKLANWEEQVLKQWFQQEYMQALRSIQNHMERRFTCALHVSNCAYWTEVISSLVDLLSDFDDNKAVQSRIHDMIRRIRNAPYTIYDVRASQPLPLTCSQLRWILEMLAI